MRDPAKARELWNPIAKIWFPQGPDHPNLAVLKVDVRSAEYWASSSSRVERWFGLAKAVSTGDEHVLGENKSVQVTPRHVAR